MVEPNLWFPWLPSDACAVQWRRPLLAVVAEGRLVRLRASEWVAAYYRGLAVRGAGSAMAQQGKLLKEQKYDRQLR